MLDVFMGAASGEGDRRLRGTSHATKCFAPYVEIRRNFPRGFFQIAGDSGCVSQLLLPKCGGPILCKKKGWGFITCPLGILTGDVGPRGLRNPRGSWEKLHMYMISAHPKTIKPPTTGVAHCALPTTILFFRGSFVDRRAP